MSTLARNFKGLLGTKLGMTQVFDAAGQLAFGEVKPKRVNKPLKGHFAKSGVEPRRHLVELRTADAGNYSAGQELKPDAVFAQGGLVMIRSAVQTTEGVRA